MDSSCESPSETIEGFSDFLLLAKIGRTSANLLVPKDSILMQIGEEEEVEVEEEEDEEVMSVKGRVFNELDFVVRMD